jgi:RNase P protein component
MYKLPGDLDLVISVRPAGAEASFEELNEEFLSSLSKFNRDRMAK